MSAVMSVVADSLAVVMSVVAVSVVSVADIC